MGQNKVFSESPGKRVGSVIAGVALGILLPVLAVLQITMLLPVLMLGGIFSVWLYAHGGWGPMLALATSAATASVFLLGTTMAITLLIASVLPALIIVRGIVQKRPFFEQMRSGIIAYILGLLAAMMVAYQSFGSGMVARFVDLLRSEYDLIPDVTLQPMMEWLNELLATGGMTGRSSDLSTFRSLLSGFLDLLEQTYAQILPGSLLSGALLSGILSVLWGNWTMARRGFASNESFIGLSRWFMPAGVSVGMIGMLLVGLILSISEMENGTTAYMTIAQTVGAAFAVQAVAAIDRRLMRAGRTLGSRKVWCTIISIFGLAFRGFGSALAYVGAASALFGSHGAIREWGHKQKGDHDNDNNPDQQRRY